MHAVIRTYSGKGAKELIDLLEKSHSDVEKIARSVKGLVSYSLVRTDSGGCSVSVYQTKAGDDELARLAREWNAMHATNIGASPPAVTEGEVVLQLN